MFEYYQLLCPHLDEYGPSGKKDFDNTTKEIIFKAGSKHGASISVAIPVFDDAADEPLEGFILVLDADTSLTKSTQVSFTRRLRTALVKIVDNDRELN